MLVAADLAERAGQPFQNKMHWATHGHTAAEIIHARADATKPFMGLQSTRPGSLVRKEDAAIAKNYLTEPELQIRASANASLITCRGLCSTLAHTRLWVGRGRSVCFAGPVS